MAAAIVFAAISLEVIVPAFILAAVTASEANFSVVTDSAASFSAITEPAWSFGVEIESSAIFVSVIASLNISPKSIP